MSLANVGRVAVALSPVPPATLRFAAVTVLAAFGALYIAFELRLDSPYWAATTVLIVAQPVPGQVVGKGLYRAVGTVLGAVTGLVLIACFAQSPEFFIAAIAAWVAACTYVSLLLRGFRAYGAVLAGYTAAIVAFGSAAHPETVFDVAVARGSAILLGVASAALASALLLPTRSRQEAARRLRSALDGAASLIETVASGRDGVPLRRQIVQDIVALEPLLEAAQAETLDVARRSGSLHAATSEIFAVLSAARAVEDTLRRSPAETRNEALSWYAPVFAREVLPGLDSLRERIGMAGREVVNVHARHAEVPAVVRRDAPHQDKERGTLKAEQLSVHPPDLVTAAIVAGRLSDAAGTLARAAEGYAGFVGSGPSLAGPRLLVHRDPAQARRNAVRAFLAVVLAGAFWVASAWSAGGTFVTNVCVACSLFAAQPSPSAAALGFMKGAALATIVAFCVKFLVLPWIDGFPLLVMVVAPFVFAGAVVTTLPGWFGSSTAFSVIFLSNVGPTNVMSYDPTSYLDGAAGTLSAFLVSATIYRLVLPTDPGAASARILARMRRDLRRLATQRRAVDVAGTRSLMYDRLSRMTALGSPASEIASGVAILSLAHEVAGLRARPVPPGAEDTVAAALSEMAQPVPDAERLSAAADEVGEMPGADGAELLGIAATLRILASGVAEHRAVFETLSGAHP